MDDAEALADDRRSAATSSGVAPVVTAQSVTATYEGASHSVGTFTGTTPSYLLIDNNTRRSTARRSPTPTTPAHRRVAAARPDRRRGPRRRRRQRHRGQDGVRSTAWTFKVVGILAEKGSTGPQDQDDRVIAPPPPSRTPCPDTAR